MHFPRLASLATLLASFTLVNSLKEPALSPRFNGLHEIALSQDGCEISCFIERNQHTFCYMECSPDSNQAASEPTREILPLLRARANGEKEGTTTSTINVPCSGQNIKTLQARANGEKESTTTSVPENACGGQDTQKLQARAHTIRHANTTASPAAVSTITVTVTITTIPDYCLTAVHFSPIPIVPTATLTQASSLLAAASAALQSATATTGPANTSISIITPAPAPVPIIPAPKLIGTAANAGIPQGANSTLPRLTPTPTSTTIGAAAPIQPVRGDASSFTRREEFSIAVSTALGILLFDWVFVPFLRAMAERATRAVKRE